MYEMATRRREAELAARWAAGAWVGQTLHTARMVGVEQYGVYHVISLGIRCLRPICQWQTCGTLSCGYLLYVVE